jgi:hypothetical protein
MTVRVLGLCLIAACLGTASPAQDRFDHLRHRRLFPSCASCHAGAGSPGESLWPAPTSCAACHDGTVESRVTWEPRREPRRSNMRFDHGSHAAAAQKLPCTSCHTEPGAPRMAVQPPVARRCLDCHGVRTAHLAAPDSACATCHVPLAEATRLTRADIAAFPAPPSHADADFITRQGHGDAARAAAARGGSCAACHAREFCYQCHTGAAPPRAIAALAPDPRSTAIVAHRAPPGHGTSFVDRHGVVAAAGATRCAGCHVRSDCLDCHRPNAAAAPGYHPDGFVARHPAAAYARETSCADCHNVGSFCTACHAEAGLVAADGGLLESGYHDAKQFFVAGHGQAARQSLESCVACHTERDCLSCHSSVGGRRFNPHGPGFDPARMRRKNFEMCTVCHGAAVPTR